MCSNPWSDLPAHPDFVLAADAPFAAEFSRGASDRRRLRLELLPEPLMGPRDAPVVVLLLNPGVGAEDAVHHRNPTFANALRADIASTNPATHFHLTDPTHGPGRAWWRRACRSLIAEVGIDTVAANLLSIEFSRYHSISFAHGHVRFPSQEFSFALLRSAMKRNAVVICMRGSRHWCGAVPELGTYSNLLVPKNARVASLSSGNLAGGGRGGRDAYGRIVAAMREAR